MIEDLRVMSLFRGMDPGVLERFICEKHIYKAMYNKETLIYNQNTRCNTMDLVCSGKLEARTLAPNGSETVLFEFTPGSIVGPNLLFGNRNVYPMSIVSTMETIVVHITKYCVAQLLRDYGFTMEFVKIISENSQGMNKKISMFTQKTLRDNLVDYLQYLAIEQKTTTVLLPITKKQLANYLGVQRPSLFRELKRMKEEGLIEISNRNITMHF